MSHIQAKLNAALVYIYRGLPIAYIVMADNHLDRLVWPVTLFFGASYFYCSVATTFLDTNIYYFMLVWSKANLANVFDCRLDNDWVLRWVQVDSVCLACNKCK